MWVQVFSVCQNGLKYDVYCTNPDETLAWHQFAGTYKSPTQKIHVMSDANVIGANSA